MYDIELNHEVKKIILAHPKMFHRATLKRGAVLCTAGNMTNKMYYIEQGIIKTSFPKNSGYATIAFYGTDEMLIPYSCFVQNSPSIFNLEVVRQAKTLVLTKNDWYQLLQKEWKLNELANKILVNSMYKFINYACYMNNSSAAELYAKIMADMPYLAKLPDREIAEFTGLSRTTINNVKNKKEEN